jgi:hypothetical protein
MGSGPDMLAKWAGRLSASGASECAVSAWRTLRTAVVSHQRLLRDEGIGVEVSERDRVRVNARRVGLQAPLFADETDFASTLRMGQADGATDGESSGSDAVSGKELRHLEDVARAVARANAKR